MYARMAFFATLDNEYETIKSKNKIDHMVNPISTDILFEASVALK